MKMMGLPINSKRHPKRVSVVCVSLHRVDNVRIKSTTDKVHRELAQGQRGRDEFSGVIRRAASPHVRFATSIRMNSGRYEGVQFLATGSSLYKPVFLPSSKDLDRNFGS